MNTGTLPGRSRGRNRPLGPLWAIATREWLTQTRDPKLPLFAAVVAVLIPLSTYVNGREYVAHNAAALELQSRVRDFNKTRGDTLTGRDLEPGLRLVRKTPIGFTLVRGLEAELPEYYDVGPAGVRVGPPPDGYLAAAETSLDVEFIVRVILGLYALLLGIEAVALERAQRTLHALIAQPVPLATVIGGKLLAAVAILTLSALWVALLSAVSLLVANNSTGVWGSTLPLFSIAAFCYLLSCYLLGVVLSHVGGGFQRALIFALSVWVCLNVVSIPLAGSVARALAGQRSRSDFEGELQRAYDAMSRESELRLGAELVHHAGRTKWWDIEKYPEDHKRVGAMLEPVWREYATHWADDLIAREAHWLAGSRWQDRISVWLSALSPGLAFGRLASTVTRTGPIHALAWHESVVNYQARLYGTLVGNRSQLSIRVPSGGRDTLGSFPRRSDLAISELPPYDAPPESRRRLLRYEFLIIPVQCILLFAVAATLFARAGRS